MKWIIKMITPERTAYDGIKEEYKEIDREIPFDYFSDVYYVHHKKQWKANSPFVITKSRVTGVWATNTFGVILDGANHVSEDEFNRIFTDRDAAIEYCLKKNEHRKVKIYGE